jgi:hypothetical protein
VSSSSHSKVSLSFFSYPLTFSSKQNWPKSHFGNAIGPEKKGIIRHLQQVRRHNHRRRSLLVSPISIRVPPRIPISPLSSPSPALPMHSPPLQKLKRLPLPRLPHPLLPLRRHRRARPPPRHLFQNRRPRLPPRLDNRLSPNHRAHPPHHRNQHPTTIRLRAIPPRIPRHGRAARERREVQ